MKAYREALDFTLSMEGGYVNDPDDPGGATNFGVTQVSYTHWLYKQGLPARDVMGITREEVDSIYRNYWTSARCDDLPYPLNVAHFDASINHGPRNAIRILQEGVGADVDGVVGPQTLTMASHAYAKVERVLLARLRFYYDICRRRPASRKFLLGWVRRIVKLQAYIRELDHG